MESRSNNGATWLHIETDNGHASIFMTEAAAAASASAFNAAMKAEGRLTLQDFIAAEAAS